MNNKIIMGFGAFLAIFLAFPFVAQMMKGNTQGAPETEVTTEAQPAKATIPDEPPEWNSSNIVGTEWEVDYEGQARVKITILDQGVCYVSHPLMRSAAGVDYVEGRWRIDYNTAYVRFSLGPKEYDFALPIRGDKIYEPRGFPIKRL